MEIFVFHHLVQVSPSGIFLSHTNEMARCSDADESKCFIWNQVCTTVACSHKSGPDLRSDLKNKQETFSMDNVNGSQPKSMKLQNLKKNKFN